MEKLYVFAVGKFYTFNRIEKLSAHLLVKFITNRNSRRLLILAYQRTDYIGARIITNYNFQRFIGLSTSTGQCRVKIHGFVGRNNHTNQWLVVHINLLYF
ncbi:hypothetical protein SRM1_01549 [Pseudomonas fluorescens]|nr:hypothetical protein SRM1_01549 [Pseudomonas fluorescens]